MEPKKWGTTKDGEDIIACTITDGVMSVSVMNYGATVLGITVADADGVKKDIALGYGAAEDYFDCGTYFGMTVARSANRIAGASFTLDGVTYQLDKNDGENSLHSGYHALSNRVWQVTDTAEDSVTFSYDSPDGDMGFGGSMHIDVTYTVRDNALLIDYHAKADKNTVFNPTNHSYFNLKGHGEGDITDHSLIIYADEVTYADEQSLPDGTIRKVAGTPFDFTKEKRIGDEIDADYDMINFGQGYDHNYVLRGDTDDASEALAKEQTEQPYKSERKLAKAAKLIAPDGRFSLNVYTDLPGMQIYTGNFIDDGTKGKDGKTYVRRGGVALETQYFPNAVNIPSFAQPVIKAGEDFYSRTVYKVEA